MKTDSKAMNAIFGDIVIEVIIDDLPILELLLPPLQRELHEKGESFGDLAL